MENIMSLDIWQGDWGLPSVDVHCLQTMAYAKFAGIPVKLFKTNNPWWSPSGTLPVFKQGDAIICTKFQEVLTHFRKESYGIDSYLSAKQCSDVSAYTALINNKLYPALLYIWWVDSRNYKEFTQPWYCRVLPFPFRYYLPRNFQRSAQNNIDVMFGGDHLSDEDIESAIYKNAQECLNLLSVRLGNSEFFFGKSPSALDATVFAHLAPLLKAPFPSNALQNHLKNCSNLCELVNRILLRYFPLDPLEQEENWKKEAETRSKQSADALEFPNKRRSQILAGLVAFSAMVIYALMSGLIKVEIVNHDDDDDDDDESDDNDDNMHNIQGKNVDDDFFDDKEEKQEQ